MAVYSFYDNLLEKLHMPEPRKVANLLLMEDYDFYMKYFHLQQQKQFDYQNGAHGGGGKEKIIKYKYDKYEFIIYELKESDRISYTAVYNGNISSDNPCVCIALFVPINEKYCY